MPLAVGVKDEVFVVDAVDLSGEVFCPFDGVALTGTDLQGPGCVDAQANFGRAEADEVFEYAGLTAKVISAVTVDAHAYAVFPAPCAYLCDGFGIGFELEMAGDVFGTCDGGAFKVGFFSGVGDIVKCCGRLQSVSVFLCSDFAFTIDKYHPVNDEGDEPVTA